jgi:hypothetical protein
MIAFATEKKELNTEQHLPDSHQQSRLSGILSGICMIDIGFHETLTDEYMCLMLSTKLSMS